MMTMPSIKSDSVVLHKLSRAVVAGQCLRFTVNEDPSGTAPGTVWLKTRLADQAGLPVAPPDVGAADGLAAAPALKTVRDDAIGAAELASISPSRQRRLFDAGLEVLKGETQSEFSGTRQARSDARHRFPLRHHAHGYGDAGGG